MEERSFPDWSMELVNVTAGWGSARTELGNRLPGAMAPPVRDLVLRMSDSLADGLHHRP